MWYEWLSAISRALSEPFLQLSQATTVPELSALVLGMVGAFAPCQLTAHVGALAYFSERAAGERFSASELAWYLVGRMAVYTVLGVAAYLLGKEWGNQLIPLFSWSRKALGPLLVLTGLVMLGWLRWRKGIGGRLEAWGTRLALLLAPRGRAFLLGVAFSLAFARRCSCSFLGSSSRSCFPALPACCCRPSLPSERRFRCSSCSACCMARALRAPSSARCGGLGTA
ncbi:sulfite exporter TauE/SafE family protein [Calditerricola satsumensis]|uniref:sulfite exporter TauE/SafE family protein n=1 Tax=Calditerricola satsumensis TaxID=373054 RepID=UPI0006D0543D|nr:sulfite exporter TauE/SafE family protein [Calditerricola satsumensis]